MAYPNGFGDEDLDTFLEDFGILVTWAAGGVTDKKGLFDNAEVAHDFNAQRSEVMAGVPTLLVKKADFPGLPKNALLSVDGVPYYSGTSQDQADGRFMRVPLRLV